MSTPVVQAPQVSQTQPVVATSANSVTTSDTSNADDGKTPLSSYVVVVLISVGIIGMMYYAYTKYMENSCQEAFVEGNRQERDDPVADFNLQAALNDLDAIQRSILKKLSSDTGM